MTFLRTAAIGAAGLLAPIAAFAQATGEDLSRTNWGLGLPEAKTDLAERLFGFHNNLLLPIIIVISLFVLALLVYVVVRFNEKANPEPKSFTHNTKLEVAWTAIPALILVVMAFPSFSLLYEQDKTGDADMTIKATGYQWYWGYDYPDNGDIQFDAYPLGEDEAAEEGLPYLLATDNRVVLPSDTKIRVLVTAGDVLHAWTVPEFGVKTDAVPDRNNEIWFNVPAGNEGIYYGQCSEICGTGHAYMPIMVEVVDQATFAAWTSATQQALLDGTDIPKVSDLPTQFAAAN